MENSYKKLLRKRYELLNELNYLITIDDDDGKFNIVRSKVDLISEEIEQLELNPDSLDFDLDDIKLMTVLDKGEF